jgi:hypothetical protein
MPLGVARKLRARRETRSQEARHRTFDLYSRKGTSARNVGLRRIVQAVQPSDGLIDHSES